MDIDFELRAPLKNRVFDENEKKTEAYVASINDDLADRLPTLARAFEASIHSMRDGNGERVDPETDNGQAIANKLYQASVAYLAYRMGDAMSLDVRQEGETTELDGSDVEKRRGFVLSWLDHLAHTYDPEMAASMMRHVTNTVDTVLLEYFPRITEHEPKLKDELANASQGIGRRAALQRQLTGWSAGEVPAASKGELVRGTKGQRWDLN